MKVRCKWTQSSGFTLIELMIASVILSVGVLGMIAVVFASMRGNSTTLENLTMASLANQLINRIQGGSFCGSVGDIPGGSIFDCSAAVVPAGIGIAKVDVNQDSGNADKYFLYWAFCEENPPAQLPLYSGSLCNGKLDPNAVLPHKKLECNDDETHPGTLTLKMAIFPAVSGISGKCPTFFIAKTIIL